MTSPVILILLSIFSIFSFLRTDVSAEGYFWGFDRREDLQMWQVLNAGSCSIEDKNLVIRDATSPRIISPGPLRITPEESALWLRIKGLRDSDGTLILETKRGRIFLKGFRIFKGGFHDYRLYIGDLIPEGDYVTTLGVDFARNDEVAVDYIRVFRPTTFELLETFWYGFWEPDTVTIKTINFVTTPKFGPFSFMTLLYILSALVFLPLFFLYRRRGLLNGEAVKRAAPLSLLTAALLFAVRMDYNFLSIWKGDLKNFSGKDVKERIKTIYAHRSDLDDFFDFLDFVKRKVPADSTVRPASRGLQDPLAVLARYYLLPVRTSERAAYLWVYNDDGLAFNRDRMVLERNGRFFLGPVAEGAVFRNGAALYRLAVEGEG